MERVWDLVYEPYLGTDESYWASEATFMAGTARGVLEVARDG